MSIKIDDKVQVRAHIHYIVNHGNEKFPYPFAGVRIDDGTAHGRIIEIPLALIEASE